MRIGLALVTLCAGAAFAQDAVVDPQDREVTPIVATGEVSLTNAGPGGGGRRAVREAIEKGDPLAALYAGGSDAEVLDALRASLAADPATNAAIGLLPTDTLRINREAAIGQPLYTLMRGDAAILVRRNFPPGYSGPAPINHTPAPREP